MSAYSKDKQLAFSKYRATSLDEFFKHAQSVGIYGQHPLPMTLLLLGLNSIYFVPALGTECVAFAQSLAALSAR